MSGNVVSWYEQPLNERVRTFLRLEHLTTRLHHHAADMTLWGRRARLEAVLDLLNVMSRHDIRGEVSRALAQRRMSLAQLSDREDIDTRALDGVLAEIDEISNTMARIPPQFASYLLRDNELLSSVNNRIAIPGGTCSFDLPAYRHWLAGPASRIDSDMMRWTEQIMSIEKGVVLLLRLLRDSGERTMQNATAGLYLYPTAVGAQLIRVATDRADVFPEISAGRHRATVRFMCEDETDRRIRQAQTDIPFSMVCCRF